MSFKEKNEKKLKKNYENACDQGFCPNLAERENRRIRELSKGLNAVSEKEVLTCLESYDEDVQKQLWNKTESMLGLT